MPPKIKTKTLIPKSESIVSGSNSVVRDPVVFPFYLSGRVEGVDMQGFAIWTLKRSVCYTGNVKIS